MAILQAATEAATDTNTFVNTIQTLFISITSLIGTAAAIATKLPKPGKKAHSHFHTMHKVINLLACNVGHAKNGSSSDE